MEEENKNLNVEEPTEVLGNTEVIEPVVEEPVTEPVVETPVEIPVMEAPVENPVETEPVAEMAQVETKAEEVPAETVTPMPEPASVPTEPSQETPVAQPVEAPEAPKKKSKLPLILLLLIILAAGGFAVWYFVLGGNESKKEEPKKEEEQKEEKKPEEKIGKDESDEKDKDEKKDEEINEEIFEELDISSDEVTKAMKNFEDLKISKDELTKNDSYNISSFTFKQKVETIGIVASQKDRSSIAYCGNDITTDITIDKLNEYLKETVDSTISKEEIESNGKEETISTLGNKFQGISVPGNGEFWIWIIDGKYYLHSNNCDRGSINYITYRKTTKAEKSNTHLHIYEKRGFYEIGERGESHGDGTSDVKINYYKDYAKTELVETMIGIQVPALHTTIKQESEITWDKYNTYKYTFVLKDGNYYFEKYELVK